MSRERVLAFDAGKSSTRAAVFEGRQRVASASGPGVANVASSGGLEQVRSVLGSVVAQLEPGSELTAACIGLTGVLEPDHHARAVGDLLAGLLPGARLVVTSDVVTNYCGALGAVPGVVVAAGTGAITLAAGPDGSLARVDGWGFLLDDAGSAFEIGRAGLREVLRAADGRGGSPILFDAAMGLYGSTSQLVERIYGDANPTRVVAAFAREVSEAAAAGDEVALELLRAAGGQLARSAVTAAERVFSVDDEVVVSWQGGVFGAGDLVVDPFLATVRARMPRVRCHPPDGDALDGAAELARTRTRTVLDGLLDVRQVAAS